MKYMISIIALFILSVNSMAHAFSYTQEISEDELQQIIEKKMPIKKKKYFITVIISHPKLNLSTTENNLGIKAMIMVAAPGKLKVSGTINLSGSISYNENKGTFHLLDPIVKDIHVDNIPEKIQPQVKKVAQLAVSSALANLPVYKFKDDDLKHSLAKSVLESITVKEGKLLVKLSVF